MATMKRKKKKKAIYLPVKKKPKIWAILVGIIAIGIACLIANEINDNRLARKNGIFVYAPVIHITYGIKGGHSGIVEVDRKKLSIRALDNDVEIGDSIPVLYDKEKSLVVQEKFNDNYFTAYFLIDSILLILGVLMVYGGIKGKEFSN
jgi:hypothetical protein